LLPSRCEERNKNGRQRIPFCRPQHNDPPTQVGGILEFSHSLFVGGILRRKPTDGGISTLTLSLRVSDVSLTSPTIRIARGISALRINQRQTFPLRKFSALNSVIPTSMPITSGFTHPVLGLKASTKPYRPQIFLSEPPNFSCIASSAGRL